MRTHLLAAAALCLLMNAAPVLAQTAQDRPPEPAGPTSEGETSVDQTDVQTPEEPGVPATPPGAAETPSTSPAASAGASPSTVEPSVGGAASGGMLPLDQYLTQSGESREVLGDRRRQLVDKPVVMPSGEEAGTISDFVVRDGRNYARLTLPKTPDDRERDVVAPLENLSVSPGGERVVINAQSRDELKTLTNYMPDSFQKMR